MAGKKYLLLADLPDKEERLRELIVAFLKKAYLTDSVLFVMIDIKLDVFDCFRWHFKNNVTWGTANIQLLVKSRYTPEQIVSQMDYYVAGGHPEEIFYIEAAINNGVEVIGTSEAPENIFNDIPVSPENTEYRKQLHDLIARDLFNKFPADQYEYFLFHEGLGESTSFFFWMKEYRASIDKKILMICANPLRGEMMGICPYVDGVVMMSPQMFDYVSIYFSEQYKITKTYAMHSHPRVAEIRRNLTDDELDYYNAPERVRDFLNLPSSANFKTWTVNIPPGSVARAKEVFNALNLSRGKAVFILTEGISFNGLHHHNDFWIRLAETLRLSGYEPVFNGAERAFSNFKNVYLSLFETSAFIGLCGNVVSVPTGLLEASLTFNTVDPVEWQVVFPNYYDQYYHSRDILPLLFDFRRYQSHGTRHLTDNRLKVYSIFMKEYLSANVNLSLFHWGNNVEDDDALIKKIVDNIKSSIGGD